MQVLGIFVRAPIAGQVMLRLADDVGPSTAADIAERVGLAVVDASLGAGYRAVVWFAPASEAAYVQEWLGGAGRFELRPQGGGAPAQRLATAFARHFRENASRVVMIRADCPGVTRRVVLDAFAALGTADVVLGPAYDGGVYLIGTRANRPALFRNLDWDSGTVAAQTRARAAALGLSLRPLKPLRAVETARDARLLGLLNP